MRPNDAVKIGLDTAQMVVMAYVDDLSDEELMKRPHPQCNHLNWQLGHLIASEYEMAKMAKPDSMPELPAGFAEKYTKENAAHDDPTRFCTKAELMQTYQAVRSGLLKIVDQVEDADWQKETGVSYAPTVAALLNMVGAHWLMHCGQWVILRRQLNKPVVI